MERFYGTLGTFVGLDPTRHNDAGCALWPVSGSPPLGRPGEKPAEHCALTGAGSTEHRGRASFEADIESNMCAVPPRPSWRATYMGTDQNRVILYA